MASGAAAGALPAAAHAGGRAHASGPDNVLGDDFLTALQLDASRHDVFYPCIDPHLDAEFLQFVVGKCRKMFRQMTQNARAGFNQNDTGLGGIDVIKTKHKRWYRKAPEGQAAA